MIVQNENKKKYNKKFEFHKFWTNLSVLPAFSTKSQSVETSTEGLFITLSKLSTHAVPFFLLSENH